MNDHAQPTVTSTKSPASDSCGESAAKLTDFTRVRDSPYLCAKTLRFVLNFLGQEKGTLEDDDFFDFIVHILGEKAAVNLARRSCSLEGLRDTTKTMLEASGDDTAPDVLSELWSNRRTHAPLKKGLLAALTQQREQWEKMAVQTRDQDVLRQRFEEMFRLFGLVEHESDLLLLAYVRHAGLWDWTAIGRKRTGRGPFQRICLMAQMLGLPRGFVAKYFHETGRLRSLGCLDNELDFNPELESFLIGLSAEPLAYKYFVRCTEKPLPWMMYNQLTRQHGELLKQLINRREPERGLNILLYGSPGTGKTSFALSLAAELAMDIYRIRVSEEFESNAGGARPRFAALRICDGQINHNRSLILIDEADEMLSGSGNDFTELFSDQPEGRTGKNDTLNTVLDQLKTPCIWITNCPANRLAPSSRRRFDYSIEFKPLSHQQRCQVWKNILSRHHLQEVLDDEKVESLSRRFPVSAGGVDMVLRNYVRLCGDGTADGSAVTEMLERLLTSHCELMGIAVNNAAAQAQGGYSLTGLNVRGQVSPERILQAVRQFRRWQESSAVSGENTGLNIPRLALLLSGPPGTGKTEFVKFIGRELNCPVRTCMAGDLLSRYVGGTEQNIREVFRAAEMDKAILFIDEADGMLRSRALADRSWEVTQVNELLHAMENFHGVVVCATNWVEMLDAATIRRFTFKLEFDYLDAAGKLVFYDRMFGELCRNTLDENGKRRLGGICDLAPGDFHTVRQAMYYLGSGGQGVTHDDLLAALEQESCAKRQRKGGNFGFGR